MVCFQVTGNTPLMYAAMENKTLIIEKMLDLGCDIHAKNKVDFKIWVVRVVMWFQAGILSRQPGSSSLPG